MQTIHYISVLVIRPAGASHQLLLGLRAAGSYMGGTWQLITGGIESNEAAWQAAIREVREETGLAIAELYRLSHVTQFYRVDTDAICIAPMFCAIVAEGSNPTINSEHTGLEWVAIDTANDRLMWPGDRAAVDEVQSLILGGSSVKPHLQILPD